MNGRRNRRRAALRDVRDGLRSRGGRTALTFFALAAGFATLAVLLAILSGLSLRADRIVRQLGVNVAAVFSPKSPQAKAEPGLEERHRDILARNFPEARFSAVRRFEVAAGTNRTLAVIATDSELALVRQWPMVEGRFLDSRDIRSFHRVAVVSRTLSGRRGWKTGDLIRLRDVLFRVVGIVDARNAPDAGPGDPAWAYGELSAFIPLTLSPFWRTERDGPRPALDAIFMSVPVEGRFTQAVEAARRLLAQPGMRAQGASWVLPETLRAGAAQLQKTIALAGGFASALCLVLGGLTLMSLMIANVRDRVREIGLRRSLGASPRDIALLFLLEGELTAGAAAVFSVLAVHVIFLFVAPPGSVPLRFNAATVLVPLAAAGILAAVFSYGPARSAARIMPSAALRFE